MDSYRVRFVPLGGIVGVTKNMYVYELYNGDSLQDIIIIDCGIGFPKEQDLGVDFVIPDISYLLDKKDKIRAILLSHGHEDHISALPFHYDALGRPPMFTAKLTKAFIENKFKEKNDAVQITEVDFAKEYQLGMFTVRFIRMTHSIPDTTHILIKTPVGNLYHGSDYKLDVTPPYGYSPDFYQISKAGHDGIMCLLSDSLGSEREGLTLSESVVGQTFEDEMRKTKGKFIMSTFSSNISRIRQCVEAAIKFNRKIVFMGRSMRENTRAASEIGYLPIPQALMGKEEEVMKLPGNKVCMIVAGSQGQYSSALSKLAMNQSRNIKIKPGDKVIVSSDPIPGNENEVYSMIEELSLLGADVVYTAIQDALHASGHGNQEDIKFLVRMTNPKYFIPIGGDIRHQLQYERLCVDMGYSKDQVFRLTEGETVWFEKKAARKGDRIDTKTIYIDSGAVGDVGSIVLKDRKTLSSEGMVVVMLVIDQMGKLIARPKIISRGFVFEKDEAGLFDQAVRHAEKLLKPRPGEVIDVFKLKRELSNDMAQFFFEERGRKPIVVVDAVQVPRAADNSPQLA